MKTHIYDLGGGLVEFLAIGTAVRKVPGLTTRTDRLPPQAVLQDRETFVDASDTGRAAIDVSTSSAASSRKTQGGPIAIVMMIIVFIFYAIRIFLHR